MPHLTLSFGRDNEDQKASGDLSASCVGLGCAIAWVLAAGLGMPATLAENGILPAISAELGSGMRIAFMAALVAGLLFVGSTNQRHLRFYVSNNALVLALACCIAGNVCAAFAGIGGAGGVALAIAGSAIMGAGAGLLLPLWGTAFAKSEFATITLNTAAGAALGIACATVLTDWAPVFVAVPIEAVLASVSVLTLWSMTPVPYYRRRELPVFHALRVSRVRFLLHLGIPGAIFGVPLGVMGRMCTSGAFCTSEVTCDLLVGASCALCLVLFITSIALTKDATHWDTLFRYLLPLVGLGLIGIPLFCGAYHLGAVFLLSIGLLILVVLLWLMFSDMSQEFRLSPIFVFGIGGGLVMGGAIIGALLVPPVAEWETVSSVRWTGLAMGAVVCLMVAGALNPRKRDVVKMLAEKRPIIEMAAVNQLVVDATEAGGQTATDEQLDAAMALEGEPVPTRAPEPDDRTPERKRAAAAFAQNASLIMGVPGPATEAAENSGMPHEHELAGLDVGDEPKREKGSFYRRCEEIADQYLLSRRETEVLFLLAKGHKARFIEEKLCVSRSTAKTHINHIYKKMDIHTQQELLNMVEDRPRLHQEGELPLQAAPFAHHGF